MIQLQVINYLLDTKDTSLITSNNLNVDYFSEYTNEWLFIETHLKKYGVIPDKETFVNQFKDFELIEVKEPSSYLISELLEDYKTRQLATSFNKVREYLLNNDIDKAMSTYKTIYENLDKVGVSMKVVDLLKDTSRYDKYVEKTQNINKYYVSTGFKELDDLIGGIDRQEELGLIVARTNNFKSWTLAKMAVESASKGLNVGIYSGEMSEDKVGYRIDTLISHISNGALNHANVSVQNEYQEYIKKLPNKFTGSLKVITPQSVGGAVYVSTLKSFIEREHLDILFIDQISLLEDERKGKNPTEKVSNISKDLKLLQVMEKIPIISVSQQNRETLEDNTIGTENVALSDRLAQDSTLILGVMKDKKDPTLLTIQIVKNRDGIAGKKLMYKVDINKGEFIYIPSDEDIKPLETTEEYENGNNRYIMDFEDDTPF